MTSTPHSPELLEARDCSGVTWQRAHPGIARRITQIAAAILALLCWSSIACADALLAPPPDKFVVGPGGVDMRSGRYAYTHTDLSIGGDAGLELTRTLAQLVKGHTSPFASLSHNFDIMVQEKRINIFENDFRNGRGSDFQIEVIFGGLSQTFRAHPTDTGYEQVSRASFGRLTYSAPNNDKSSASTVYTYSGSDGTTMVFRTMGSGDCSTALRCAYVSQLTRPDGTLLTFEYDRDTTNLSRLRSVSSTRGHAILLENSGLYVSKACALNLAAIAKPSTNVCPAGVPTATYTYNTNSGEQRLASVTDPSGAVWTFVNGTTTASPATITMGFKNPGDASPWLTNNIWKRTSDDGFTAEVVTAQTFSDGQSYTYQYDLSPSDYNPENPHIPAIAGGTIQDAQGNFTRVTYDFPVLPGTGPGSPCTRTPCAPVTIGGAGTTGTIVYQMTSGPSEVTDPVGRTTTSNYCDPHATDGCHVMPNPVSTTDPSGIVTNMSWEFSHLVQTTEIPRSGTGNLVRSAGYGDCFALPMRTCDKVTSLTNANGRVTNFTYDLQHGGIVSEMKPAPSSGAARPLKLTTWVQKFAYVSNGSGLVPAATPVWVINTETDCQTVAGSSSPVCDAAAPKRVTTYEYGANGTANNLLVRGVVVTADGVSRRTCFSYDNFGNQISKTSARAGLTTCP